MAREMKESGIEWIGKIPSEWKVTKTLNGLSMPITDGPHKTPELFDDGIAFVSAEAVSSGNGLIDFSHIRGFISQEFYNECCKKYIPKLDDIYMIKSGATTGKVAIVDNLDPVFTIWSPLAVFRSKKNTLCPKYLFYQLQSDGYQKQVQLGWFFGTQQNVGMRVLEQLKITIPPLSEQQLIADFLDAQCAFIDSVIKKNRTAIEEYKKLKQAIITQAVTKGIRPNREMKDSGIEWIQGIPAEWSVSCVGLHYDIILGKMLCQNRLSDDYTLEPYYCAANVHFDGVSNEGLKQMWFSTVEKEQYLVKKGDLLVVEGGAGAGGSAIVVSVDKPTYVQNSVMIVRTKGTSNNCYLRYLLEFLVNKSYIDMACNKATIPHFTKNKLANVPFLVSNEQTEIVTYLDEKTAAIDSIVQKKEQLITELEAYKKSLIYEYVTGKKEAPIHAH